MLGIGLELTGCGAGGIANQGGGPTLDYDFTTLTALPAAITFSRTSTAWQYDSAGLVVTAPHNLILYSQDTTQASWGKNNCTATGDVTTDPLGTTTADLITGTSATVSVVQNVTIPTGARVAFSVYCKAGTVSFMRIRVQSGAETASTWFNLSTGALGASPAPTANILISGQTATDAGGGWWRVSAVFSTTGLAILSMGTGPAATDNAAGTTGNTISVWGAQAELHTSARTYNATTSAAYYGARFDYDPLTLAARGLLIEEARTNLLTNSVNLAYTPWSLANIFARTPYAGLAPDGTWTATLIDDNSTAAAQYVDNTATVANDSNWVTWSLFVKAGTSDLCHLRAYLTGGTVSLGSGVGVNFTFSSKTLGTPSGTGGQGTPTTSDVGYVELPNGWFRIWVKIQNNSTGNTTLTCRIFPANTSTATIGNIYVWGAQAEAGGSMSGYVPTIPTWTARASTATYYTSTGVLTTAASGAARATHRYNGTSWIYAGQVLEAAVTNLVAGQMNSTTYWSLLNVNQSATTSPTGASDAVLLTQTAAGTTSYGTNPPLAASAVIVAGTQLTASIFAKAGTGNWMRIFLTDNNTPTVAVVTWFNLTTGAIGGTTTSSTGGTPTGMSASIQNVGGGWYRCSVSAILASVTTANMLVRMVSADLTTTDTGSKTMSFYGPQMEAGSAMTSYIPTTTASASRVADSTTLASATRAIDVATITDMTWYNQSAGTLYCEFQRNTVGANSTGAAFPRSVTLSDGTTANFIELNLSGGTEVFAITTGSVVQASALVSGQGTSVGRIAGAYAANDAAVSVNGGTVVTDTSVTLPTTVSQLRLGNRPDGARALMGYVRKVKYWRQRLSNAVIQSLTT